LERSAIPESLARTILSGSDTEAIYPAFELIFTSFSTQLSFKARDFFDAFHRAIRLHLEEEVQDPRLLEYITAQNKRMMRQLADISLALKRAIDISEPIPAIKLADSRLRLARSLEVANRYITVETLQGAKRYRIKHLAVHPRLSQMDPIDPEHKGFEPQPSGHIPYLLFKTTVRRAVILGDPGGGKSTLTQLMCYHNSNSILLEAAFPGRPEIDGAELRIPLRVILRSFEKRRNSSPGYSFFDYFIDEIKDVFDHDVDFCRQFLVQIFSVGQALLIFDGLDEILEVEARSKVVSLIEQFANSYGACPAIVTSRAVGYKNTPMSDDFTIYTLSKFNETEISTFTYRFIKLIEGIKTAEAKEKSHVFLKQTENVAPDLRENPLLLGLMVYFICLSRRCTIKQT
jgi:predicted NACHT family NTPase